MEKEDIISSALLEMYVVGVASQEERAQVDQWRLQYTDVDSEIKSIESAMESYAMANAVSPSESVKERIFASLQPNALFSGTPAVSSSNTPVIEKPQAKIVAFSPLGRIAAAAAILILLVSNVFYYNKYKNAQDLFSEGQQQLAEMNSHLTDMDRDMNIVQSKYSKPVSLDGLEAAPDAAAKIFWMKNTGEVYVDPKNLPPAPHGHQYQLWAFVDGKPVDGGMITTKDGENYKIQKMKTFGKAEAFAITLETAGGHPQPKGKIYVMGKI